MEDTITVRLRTETRDRLAALGGYGDTLDDIVMDLLDEAGR